MYIFFNVFFFSSQLCSDVTLCSMQAEKCYLQKSEGIMIDSTVETSF